MSVVNKLALNFVILLVAATIITVAYLLGSFSSSFATNMCYSNVVTIIEDSVDHAVESGTREDLLKVKLLLESLPLRGYESDCEQIFSVAKSL